MKQFVTFRGLAFALLALFVQIAAPVGAALSMGAQADLLADAPICSEHQDSRQTDGSHRHDTACPLCQVCCTAPHLLAATPAAELPLSLLVAYVEQSEGQPGLPRGPPRSTPNARAPPLS
jgi:hypothetical protein